MFDTDSEFIKDLSSKGENIGNCEIMRKSKLESYEAIMEALCQKPLDIDCLSYKLSGDCTVVKERLSFLMKNGLVEKRLAGRKKTFAITERGEAVSRTLSLQKRLEKLKATVMSINENPQLVARTEDRKHL